MGIPAWISIGLRAQVGFLLGIMRYNNGFDICIGLPFINILINTSTEKGCKKTIF